MFQKLKIKSQNGKYNSYTILRNIALLVVLLLLIISLGSELRAWSHYDIPKELRESTMIKLADDFAKGKNPYSVDVLREERPALFSHYGFLSPLFAALLMRVTGMTASLSSTLLAILLKGATLFLMWRIILSKTKDSLLSLCGVLLMSACFWRYVPCGGAYPDILGVFLTMIGYWMIAKGEQKRKYHPILLAGLMILLFYTKLYFAAFAVGILIYLWMQNKRECIIYLFSGICIGITSIFLVNLVFPLFFTESVFYLNSEVELSLWYACKQILALGKYFFIPISIMLVWFVLTVRTYIRDKRCDTVLLFVNSDKTFAAHEFIQIFFMFLAVMYFGQNGGTWLTYQLQLLMPPVLIACAQVVHSQQVKTEARGKCRFSAFILVILTVVQVLPLTIDTSLGKEQVDTWHHVYEILEKEKEVGEELLIAPPLSYWCVDNEVYTNDYGHANYVMESCIMEWRSSELYQMLFPHAEELWEQHESYRKKIREKTLAGDYQFILVGHGDYGLMEEDFARSYVLREVTRVYAGNHRWDVYLYDKKVQ